MDTILTTVVPLEKQLQSETANLLDGVTLINATMKKFKYMRNEEFYKS